MKGRRERRVGCIVSGFRLDIDGSGEGQRKSKRMREK